MVQNVMKNDEYPPKIKAGGYILIGQHITVSKTRYRVVEGV